MNFLDPGL